MADVTSQGVLSAVARKNVAAGGSLFSETFETFPGADNTWTTVVVAPDYDFATPFSGGGTYAMKVTGGGAGTNQGAYSSPALGQVFYAKTQFQLTTAASNTSSLISFSDSTGTLIVQLTITAANLLQTFPTVTSGSTITTSTLYWMWFDISITAGTLDFYINTSDSKPGTADISTTFTNTNDCDRITASSRRGCDFILDNINVNTSVI